MALIDFGSTECPLCFHVINRKDNIVATTAFLKDEADPFWHYSDTAMHKKCFMSWDKRQEFIAKYNEAMEEAGLAKLDANGNVLS